MSKYAIVETGSKQYRVEPEAIIEVELLEVPEDKKKELSLDRVLLIHDGKNIQIGQPTIKGAKVLCEYLGEFRSPKVIHYRYLRRKSFHKKKGHRQDMIRLRVKKIESAAS